MRLLFGQQLGLLLAGHHDVFRHQLVLGDVHHQFGFQEVLQRVLGRHVSDRLQNKRKLIFY